MDGGVVGVVVVGNVSSCGWSSSPERRLEDRLAFVLQLVKTFATGRQKQGSVDPTFGQPIPKHVLGVYPMKGLKNSGLYAVAEVDQVCLQRGLGRSADILGPAKDYFRRGLLLMLLAIAMAVSQRHGRAMVPWQSYNANVLP